MAELSKDNKKMKVAKKRGLHGRNFYMQILIAPALIYAFIFLYLPLLGLFIAFKDYDVISGFFASPWVGLENFKTVLTYPNFTGAIKNTVTYSFFTVFVSFPFPIILALLFNELRPTWFKKVSQTLTYMPHFLSWTAVISFFFSMCSIDGPVNDLMAKLMGEGYERVNILLDSKNFLGIIFFSHLWKAVGWNSIVYLAAITGIDASLYEAAVIDGCGKLKQTWYVTLPCIRGTAVILLIMAVGGLVNNNFEQVYGFQNVFTQKDTEVISTLIYRQGIQNGKYSLATAFGFVQGMVSFALVVIVNAISKKVAEISIW